MNQTVGILASAFVVVSAISFTIHTVALTRLLQWPAPDTLIGTLIHRGLLRTSLCRVAAAVTYFTVGTVILLHRDALPVLSLLVYLAVQTMWIVNAVADVRLRRLIACAEQLRDGEACKVDSH